jgi:hypothetical protein
MIFHVGFSRHSFDVCMLTINGRTFVMKKTILAIVVLAVFAIRFGHIALGQGDRENTQLANALTSAKVTLEAGIMASEREGKPISAKFEVEEGKLQLSVYTMKADKFSEVIVDHQTGRIAKTEPITGGEDLAAAKQQSAAMVQSKSSLRAAAEAAVKANSGFRAVSIVPTLKSGKPVADVTLAKGRDFKTVSQNLN